MQESFFKNYIRFGQFTPNTDGKGNVIDPTIPDGGLTEYVLSSFLHMIESEIKIASAEDFSGFGDPGTYDEDYLDQC